MYTQRLYDPNRLYDSNRFQDAEKKIITSTNIKMSRYDKNKLIDFMKTGINNNKNIQSYKYIYLKEKKIYIIVDDVVKEINSIYIKLHVLWDKEYNEYDFKYDFHIYLREINTNKSYGYYKFITNGWFFSHKDKKIKSEYLTNDLCNKIEEKIGEIKSYGTQTYNVTFKEENVVKGEAEFVIYDSFDYLQMLQMEIYRKFIIKDDYIEFINNRDVDSTERKKKDIISAICYVTEGKINDIYGYIENLIIDNKFMNHIFFHINKAPEKIEIDMSTI